MRAVMKFGGGVLRREQDFERAAGIIASQEGRENAVVVSAVIGVTDLLIETAIQSASGSSGTMEELRRRHSFGMEFIEGDFARLEKIVEGISLVGECSPRTRDLVSSFGERFSASIMAGFLEKAG